MSDEASSFNESARQKPRIVFTSVPPANPRVGDTYTVTATGGPPGTPIAFGAAASSTDRGICTVSPTGTVTLTRPGYCIVWAHAQPWAHDAVVQRWPVASSP